MGVKKEGREEQEDGEGKKQPLTAAPSVLRFPLSAFPISAFQHALPRPYRRNIETGAHAQRPRQPDLRPDPGGDRSHVENRPAPHARSAARNMISSPAAEATWRSCSTAGPKGSQAVYDNTLNFKPPVR